jgi:hypothetical protein
LLPEDLAGVPTYLDQADDETCAGLLNVLDIGPPPSSAEARDALSRALESLVRRAYPKRPGSFAWLQWRRLNPGAAKDFVLQEFDSSMAEDDAQRDVLHHIVACGKAEDVRSRLEAVKNSGGPIGAEAGRLLDLHFPTEDRIAQLQGAWTTERTAENLVALYYAFMTKRGESAITKPEILRTFGTPDRAPGSNALVLPRGRHIPIVGFQGRQGRERPFNVIGSLMFSGIVPVSADGVIVHFRNEHGLDNNGLQLTRAARCAPSPSAWGQSLRAALAAEAGCSTGTRPRQRNTQDG